MDWRHLWRRVRHAWIALGIAVTLGFVGWSLIAYRASGAARIAIQADSSVAVSDDREIWSFIPRRPASAQTPALVFFPGALVDPVAYAPLVHAAATAGFPSYIVELPRRGALRGGAEDPALQRRLARLLATSSTPRRWVAAGHSRGAVVVSQVAAERRAGFAGLVLIGSSHPRDVDLSTLRHDWRGDATCHDDPSRDRRTQARGSRGAGRLTRLYEDGSHRA